MPIEDPLQPDLHTLQLYRMGVSMEQISARIARLSIALGVSLSNDADLARVMNQSWSATEILVDASERRRTAKWRELRAMLVLRYGMEKRCADQAGASMTRQVLEATQHRMEREGFRPGADGMHLSRMFDT